MESDPTRMCALLVGLPDVVVVGVGEWPRWLRIGVTTRRRHGRAAPGCGGAVHDHGRREVELVDLPVFGRPARLVWAKQRWRCPNRSCPVATWTEQNPQIASTRCALTTRAARWATRQVGGQGRTVSEVARRARLRLAHGDGRRRRLRDAADRRPGPLRHGDAVGLDETLCVRVGRYRTQVWSTQIVDVRAGQLLDVIAGRDSGPACAWFAARPDSGATASVGRRWICRRRIARCSTRCSPTPVQVADPYHVIALANRVVDDCRRRVQNETTRPSRPQTRPALPCPPPAAHRPRTTRRRRPPAALGPPRRRRPAPRGVRRWAAKELVRRIYQQPDATAAADWIDQITSDFASVGCRTRSAASAAPCERWSAQIVAWHDARVSNGPTEAINNLIKRVKRVAFGFRRFDHYRIRALLYAGKPNWALLDTLTPP